MAEFGGGSPAASINPTTGTDTVDVDKALAVLRQFESSGKNITGPEVKYPSGTVDRPYGYYQIMGANIPSWTKEVLGKSMTPEQFLKDEEAQHAVAKAKFGQFAQQHSLQDAYAIWASGRPLAVSSENKDLVFGTKVKDTVAARMAAYNKQSGKQDTVASTKMADIPDMLAPQEKSLGEIAQGSPFYADTPPANQDEFNSRYQEALSFLKTPEWKAAALQAAIAALQPRAPGQSVLGHMANAVGEGAAAMGRAQTIAEEQRRTGVKEAQSAEELGLKRQQVEGQQKIQEGQLELQKGQLSIQKATLDKMDAQNQIAWKRLDLDRDRLEKEYTSIQASVDRANAADRRTMMSNLAKNLTDGIKNAQERLTLLSPDKNKAEYEAISSEIASKKALLDRVTSATASEIEKVAPGTFPKEGDTGTPQELPVPPEKFSIFLSNPTTLREAATTGIKMGGRMVKFKLTDDQMQQLEEAERVVPRPSNTFGSRLQKGLQQGTDYLGPLAGQVPQAFKTKEAQRIQEAGGLSDEEWGKLSSAEKQQRRERLAELLPDTPPKEAETWQAILASPQARKVAVTLYGEKRVARAEADLQDMKPAPNKTSKRMDKINKALE